MFKRRISSRGCTISMLAVTATTVVSINATPILELCQQDTCFGFLFMQRTAEALAARLNAVRVQLLDLCNDDLPVIADEPGAGD